MGGNGLGTGTGRRGDMAVGIGSHGDDNLTHSKVS